MPDPFVEKLLEDVLELVGKYQKNNLRISISQPPPDARLTVHNLDVAVGWRIANPVGVTPVLLDPGLCASL